MENEENNDNIYLQGYFKRVFKVLSQRCTRMFRSVCPKNACALSLSALFWRVRLPRANTTVSLSGFDLLFGAPKKRYTEDDSVCENVFISKNRRHSAKREKLPRISRSNAKASLACERIPRFPNRRQKKSFRTAPEALKFSAAAFA